MYWSSTLCSITLQQSLWYMPMTVVIGQKLRAGSYWNEESQLGAVLGKIWKPLLRSCILMVPDIVLSCISVNQSRGQFLCFAISGVLLEDAATSI